MAEIKNATDETFEALVLNNDKPVVVDFWAAWCGPCKMVAPEMVKLAEKYDGVVDVVKVDVDANPGLSQKYGIMSIPTIAYFKPGSQPQGVVGFRPLDQLEQTFDLAALAAPKVGPPVRPARTPHMLHDPGHSAGVVSIHGAAGADPPVTSRMRTTFRGPQITPAAASATPASPRRARCG